MGGALLVVLVHGVGMGAGVAAVVIPDIICGDLQYVTTLEGDLEYGRTLHGDLQYVTTLEGDLEY